MLSTSLLTRSFGILHPMQALDFEQLKESIDHITLVDHPDCITWKWFSNKAFTAKKIYLFLQDGGVRPIMSQFLWKLLFSEKTKLFAWLCANNKIPTEANLLKYGKIRTALCILYGEAPETNDHLMHNCLSQDQFGITYVRSVSIRSTLYLGIPMEYLEE